MTEQEALERCDRLINGFSVNNSTYDAFRDDKKGYPTFAKMKEFAETCKYALEELEQYRALGTVEELKEAKEKQIAKKPTNIHKLSDIIGFCPSCKNRVYYSDITNYCSSCGQKLDWGNEDDRD